VCLSVSFIFWWPRLLKTVSSSGSEYVRGSVRPHPPKRYRLLGKRYRFEFRFAINPPRWRENPTMLGFRYSVDGNDATSPTKEH
jgi:hypothetical protein